MKTRITIVDVARAAGVSKSLVSVALRNDPGVGPATRQRILRVADELGYRSNLWARSLVQGSTNLVGVLLADLGNAYHTDVVIGVEDAAAEQGLGVVISHGRGDSERMAAQLGRLVQLGVDGVVIVSAHTPPGALAEAARVMPVVVVGRPAMLPESVSGISNDDELGGRLAVTHLVDGGRSRVAFLQMSGSTSALARRDSYLRVVEERSLPATVLSPAGLDADALRGVDAVFASNDRGAVQLLAAAHDAGVSVPTELAVVGYDDTDLARLVRPQLSSIAQPRLEMGRRALEILQGGEVVRETHAPHLVVRASSAPA